MVDTVLQKLLPCLNYTIQIKEERNFTKTPRKITTFEKEFLEGTTYIFLFSVPALRSVAVQSFSTLQLSQFPLQFTTSGTL